MKKSLLTILAFVVCVSSQAQNASRLPQGFRKAEVPASAKNRKMTGDVRESTRTMAHLSTKRSILDLLIRNQVLLLLVAVSLMSI